MYARFLDSATVVDVSKTSAVDSIRPVAAYSKTLGFVVFWIETGPYPPHGSVLESHLGASWSAPASVSSSTEFERLEPAAVGPDGTVCLPALGYRPELFCSSGSTWVVRAIDPGGWASGAAAVFTGTDSLVFARGATGGEEYPYGGVFARGVAGTTNLPWQRLGDGGGIVLARTSSDVRAFWGRVAYYIFGPNGPVPTAPFSLATSRSLDGGATWTPAEDASADHPEILPDSRAVLAAVATSEDALVVLYVSEGRLRSLVFPPETANLVPNAQLEQDPSSDYYTAGSATFSWATDAAHSPSHSLKIVSAQPAGTITRWMSKAIRIPVKPSASYDLSGWLKTLNATRQSAPLGYLLRREHQHLSAALAELAADADRQPRLDAAALQRDRAGRRDAPAHRSPPLRARHALDR